MKKNILLSLGLFILIGISISCIAANKSKTVVYYFWSNPRCISCKKIENYTKDTLNTTFSKELKNGSIEFKVVDYSKDKSFQKKYGLYTKSVVLSKIENNKEIKCKNLDKIWTKLNNEADFKKYIETEIKNFNK